MLTHLRFTVRSLRKAPGFTAIALSIVALGVGANTAIFTLLNAFLLRPISYENPEQLVAVEDTMLDKGIAHFGVSGPKYLEWRKQNTVFAQIGAFTVNLRTLSGQEEPTTALTFEATPSFLKVFKIKPLLGRHFQEDEDQAGRNQVAILGHDMWAKRFAGRKDVIGQTIALDGLPFTIIGVLPDNLSNLDGEGFLFVPLPAEKIRIMPDHHFYQVNARLKEGVTIQQAQMAIAALSASLNKSGLYGNWGVAVTSFEEVLRKNLPDRRVLLLLQAAVFLVLLIVCANIANLLLSRSAARRREIAVRMSLGGTRAQVMRQLLLESIVLSSLGGVLGVGLAALAMRLLTRYFGFLAQLPLDTTVLIFALTLSVLTGLIFGLAPAWQQTRLDLQSALKSSGTSTGTVAHRRTLDALTVAEIALALVLLICAGLFVRDLHAAMRLDPGFNPENVLRLEVALPQTRYEKVERRNQFIDEALAKFRALPGVRNAAVGDGMPGAGAGSWYFGVEGRAQNGAPDLARVMRISPDYFATIGMPLLRGRALTTADRRDTEPVVVVNESLARRYFPKENPIGARIFVAGAERWTHTIIGVVKDDNRIGTARPVDPTTYVPINASWEKGPMTSYIFAFYVRTELEPAAQVKAMQKVVRDLDPEMAFMQVSTLTQAISGFFAPKRIGSYLLGTFALIALLLAALGVYGVMATAVSQRTNEIGIRMALGAHAKHVLKLVVGRGVALTALGLLLGLAGAFVLTRILRSFLQEVSPTDPLTFGLVTLVLGVVALLACYLPARRAAQADPIAALRSE